MLIHNFYFKSPWFSSKILHGFASIFRHASRAVPGPWSPVTCPRSATPSGAAPWWDRTANRPRWRRPTASRRRRRPWGVGRIAQRHSYGPTMTNQQLFLWVYFMTYNSYNWGYITWVIGVICPFITVAISVNQSSWMTMTQYWNILKPLDLGK